MVCLGSSLMGGPAFRADAILCLFSISCFLQTREVFVKSGTSQFSASHIYRAVIWLVSLAAGSVAFDFGSMVRGVTADFAAIFAVHRVQQNSFLENMSPDSKRK